MTHTTDPVRIAARKLRSDFREEFGEWPEETGENLSWLAEGAAMQRPCLRDDNEETFDAEFFAPSCTAADVATYVRKHARQDPGSAYGLDGWGWGTMGPQDLSLALTLAWGLPRLESMTLVDVAAAEGKIRRIRGSSGGTAWGAC